MSAPYREETSFEVAVGTRALWELRRAARPGLHGASAFFAIGLIGIGGVIASDRWHDPTSFIASAVVLVAAGMMASRVGAIARKQTADPQRTRGFLDDEGVVLEADGGASTRWSWERVTFTRRTATALALFLDTDWAVVILAEQTPHLDRIADFASARARARRRAPSLWMLAVVLAQIVLTGIAAWPPALETPRARIEDALDRHVEPSDADVDALAYGSLCDRAALWWIGEHQHRRDLLPSYDYDDERATVMVASDMETCAEGAVTPRGRVIFEDPVLDTCTYYVFTLRDQPGFVIAGPYGYFDDEAWSHPETTALDVDVAIREAMAMHGRVTGRSPSSSPEFAVTLRDEDDDPETW